MRTDVSSAAAVEAMVTAAVDGFGGLHHAVNAAAIECETTFLADCEESTFDRLMAVNVKSIYLCMKYELRAMLARRRDDRQHRVHELVPAAPEAEHLHRDEARGRRHDEGRSDRVRRAGRAHQRDRARRDRHAHAAQRDGRTRVEGGGRRCRTSA